MGGVYGLAERFDCGAVVGIGLSLTRSLVQRAQKQRAREYLRCLHGRKGVARHVGRDDAVLDALDAVLDRNDRRGRAVRSGRIDRLGDDRLGDERPRAVMHGHKRRILRRGVDAGQDGGGPATPAARDRAQLGDAKRPRKLGIGDDILLAAHQHDIAHIGAFFKRGQRMRQHGDVPERQQQLVFPAHTAGRAGGDNHRADRGGYGFFLPFSKHGIRSLKKALQQCKAFAQIHNL